MEKFLSICRWILHKLFLALLGASIWLFIPLVAITVNVTDSNQVKLWLAESNTYSTVSQQFPNFVELDEEKSFGEEGAPSSIDQEKLVEAISPAFDEEFLKTEAEGFIDGLYAWLRGETVEPKFSINLSSKADEVSKLMSEELTRQLKQLPPCNVNDPSKIRSFDPLEANCLPQGVDVSEQVAKSVDEFVKSEDSVFTQDITQDDLEIGADAKTNGPVVFESLQLATLFFWAFLIAFSAIVVLTARRWQRGLKEVGTTLMVASGLLVLLSFISGRMSSAPGNFVVDQESNDQQAQAARAIFEPLAKTVTNDIASTALFFSLIVFAIGSVCLLAGWYFGKPKGEQNNSDKAKDSKDNQDDVPELMRDDNNHNFIDQVHQEKTSKPKKIKEKIKKKLIQ